jgi:hypothetical protein
MKRAYGLILLTSISLLSCGSSHVQYPLGIYSDRSNVQTANIGEINDDYSLGNYNISGYVSSFFDGGYIISDQSGNIPLYSPIELEPNIYYSFYASTFYNDGIKCLTNLKDLLTIKTINPEERIPITLYKEDLDSIYSSSISTMNYYLIFGNYDKDTKTLTPIYHDSKIILDGDIANIENGQNMIYGYPYAIDKENKNIHLSVKKHEAFTKKFPESSYLGKKCKSRHEAVHYMDSFLLKAESSSSLLIMYPYVGTINDEIKEIYRGLESVGGMNIGIYESAILDSYDFLSFKCTVYQKEYATKDGNKDKIIPTYQNANAAASPKYSKRAENYNAFKIDGNTNTISVSTSEQLWFAVEQGYKPIPVSSSKAEKYYNLAKKVLIDICCDEMDDYDKVISIYNYLSSEIYYDYDVSSNTDDWKQYSSYYLEGVFDAHLAACDGLSKAFVLLCGIEGISSIRAFGIYTFNSTNYYHAYNYVNIDGNYSLVCVSKSRIKATINNAVYSLISYNSIFASSNYFSKAYYMPYNDVTFSDIQILAYKQITPTVYERQYLFDGDFKVTLFERDKDLLISLLRAWNNLSYKTSTIEVTIFIDLSSLDNLILEAVKEANLDASKIQKLHSGFSTYIFAKIA